MTAPFSFVLLELTLPTTFQSHPYPLFDALESMSIDTHVLIIGAGMSGVGTAIQLQRKYGNAISYEITEKCDDVGGTWLVNTCKDAKHHVHPSEDPY